MSEHVAESANISPCDVHVSFVHVCTQLNRGLTDSAEASFDCILDDPGPAEGGSIHPSDVLTNPIDVLDYIVKSSPWIGCGHGE